jgi:hypothetical protein
MVWIYVLLTLAGLFALASLLIALAFVRPVPRQTAAGIITAKDFKPADTYTHVQMTGRRNGFYSTTTIPIAECYVFTLGVEGWPEDARYALNTIAAKEFQVGQKVNIIYEVRSLPLFWKRVYVVDMMRTSQ